MNDDAADDDATDVPALRAALIDSLRAARDAERDVFASMIPAARDTPASDGGWSPNDVQAHVSAWRQRQTDRLVALREGRDAPELVAGETDALNATIQAARADWSWERVVADADATTAALIGEVEQIADAMLVGERVVGTIMGNGAEHTIAHLGPVAQAAGHPGRVEGLASAVEELVDRDGWPSGPAAVARYNLACYHPLAGRLDQARSLLRLALPGQEELRELAPTDDDLIALRDEVAGLGG